MNFNKKIIEFCSEFTEYFFPFLCFLITIAFYLRTYDSCQIKITLVHIGGIVFFTLWLIKILQTNEYKQIFKNKYLNQFLLPVLFFLISGIISYYLSPFKSASLEEISKRLIYVATFLMIVFEFNSLKKIESLALWITLGALVSSLYGMVQFFGLDPFAWKGAFGDRLFSTFGNPNFFSAYLVWTIPVMISYVFLTKKWSYSFIIILSIFCVIMSKSKASWIGLSFALFTFSILSIRYFAHIKQENLKKIMTIIVISVLLFSAFGVWFLSRKRIDSLRFRVFTWQSTLNMINKPVFVSPQKSKILGTGIGTFKIVYPAYRMPQIFHIEGKHNTETDHPENEFLEILYDEGIIGFGIFLLMLFLIFYASFYKLNYISKTIGSIQKKNLSQEQKNIITLEHYLVGLISGVSGMLVHNTMCVNMRFVSSGFFFWIMLGLIISILKIYDVKMQNFEDLKASKTSFYTKIALTCLLLIFCGLIVKKNIDYFSADYHHNRGIAYSKAGIYDKAISEYYTALRLNPNYIMSYYFMGNVFLDRWDMMPKYNATWGDKNNILRKDSDRAKDIYEKLKSLAPNYVQVHFQMGMLYLKLEDYSKSIENFEKYLKLDPVYPFTYSQLGWIYTKQQNWQKAEEIYQKGLEQNPNSGLLYFNLGNMWYFRQDIEKAMNCYLKSIDVDKNFEQAYKNAIFLLLSAKQLDKAVYISKKLLEINPNDDYAKQVIAEATKSTN